MVNEEDEDEEERKDWDCGLYGMVSALTDCQQGGTDQDPNRTDLYPCPIYKHTIKHRSQNVVHTQVWPVLSVPNNDMLGKEGMVDSNLGQRSCFRAGR